MPLKIHIVFKLHIDQNNYLKSTNYVLIELKTAILKFTGKHISTQIPKAISEKRPKYQSLPL